MNFPPILILAIIWLLIGPLLTKMNKAKQQAAGNAKPGAAKTAAKAPKSQETTPAAEPRPEAFRPTVMQPTITITENDDSVYQGSLNAVTGEGSDPCHEEQLSSITFAETAAVPAAEAQEPGLQLSWAGSDIVRGFVMSEILTRK